jgi:type II secretory pathway pseudopilin PulG
MKYIPPSLFGRVQQSFAVRAFTMVEILGAVGVAATLAVIAITSVSGTIEAGQKAAMQRELQTLNATWQNYTSMGGVMVEGADAPVAARTLMVGTDLSGVSFQGLTKEPSYKQYLGGERFVMVFNGNTGFSYRSEKGMLVGMGGMQDYSKVLLAGYAGADDSREYFESLSSDDKLMLYMSMDADAQQQNLGLLMRDLPAIVPLEVSEDILAVASTLVDLRSDSAAYAALLADLAAAAGGNDLLGVQVGPILQDEFLGAIVTGQNRDAPWGVLILRV